MTKKHYRPSSEETLQQSCCWFVPFNFRAPKAHYSLPTVYDDIGRKSEKFSAWWKKHG